MAGGEPGWNEKCTSQGRVTDREDQWHWYPSPGLDLPTKRKENRFPPTPRQAWREGGGVRGTTSLQLIVYTNT